MVRSLSTAVRTAKNLAEQDNRYTFLLELTVTDAFLGTTTVRVARATESVLFAGQTYQPIPFALGKQTEDTTGELHELEIGIIDLSGQLRDWIYDNDIDGAAAKLILTFFDGFTHELALENDFVVRGWSATFEAITVRLGSRNFFEVTFPGRPIDRDRCPFIYKGDRCAYVQQASGVSIPNCDHTLNGPNGCKVHENQPHFGGFAMLPLRRFTV